MRISSKRTGMWALVAVFTVLCDAQTSTAAFEIETSFLPDAIIDQPYSAVIVARGGTAPLSWKLDQGSLPPELTLQPSGAISGTATTPGVYKFRVMVTDATGASAARDFTIRVLNYLVVEWKNPPALSQNTISGSLQVANYSKDTFDLTVMVVAVNEIGKAFALGYQRFDLMPSAQQVIPFSSSLPNGQYVVHGDAIAEIAARNQIYRVHLQTERTFTVNVNR